MGMWTWVGREHLWPSTSSSSAGVAHRFASPSPTPSRPGTSLPLLTVPATGQPPVILQGSEPIPHASPDLPPSRDTEWGSVIVPKAALPFSSLSPVGRTLGSPLPLSASLRAVAAPLEAPCTAGGSSGGAGPSSFSGAEGGVLRITLPESWGHRAPRSAPHCRAQGCTLWLRQVCRGPGVKSRLLPAG